MSPRLLAAAAVLACCAGVPAARAQPGTPPQQQPSPPAAPPQQTPPGTAPIHGQSVMGDRDRNVGPDGWVQAPIPRTQSATGARDHDQNTSESMRRNVPDTGRHLSAGENPSTPLPTRNSGPSGANPDAPAK